MISIAQTIPIRSRPKLPPRVRLMGMPIDCVTQAQAVAHILDSLAGGYGGWVITPNLDQLRQYHERPELRPMYEEANLILADGMPLIWASQIQRTPLPERVAGSELIYTLSASVARVGRSIFLLGGNPGTAAGAGEQLKRLNPLLKVAGTHCPKFGFEKDEKQVADVLGALTAGAPDIVFVGLGFPKQEKLIETVRRQFPRTWFLGIGISFSFVCGQVKRAPKWMRRAGLEWAHRMMQEPGRLFQRYVMEDIPFAMRLLGDVTGRGSGRQ